MNVTEKFKVPEKFTVDISRVKLGAYDFYINISGYGFDTGEPIDQTYEDVPDGTQYDDHRVAINYLINKYTDQIQEKVDKIINKIMDEIKHEKEIGWWEEEE